MHARTCVPAATRPAGRHTETLTASSEMTGRLEMAPFSSVALIHVPRRHRPDDTESACR